MEDTIKENYILANGINTFYVEQGVGYPILFLHGGAGTAMDWANHFSELSKRYHAIALDSRGHGRSDNPSGKFSYRLMADDTAEFIKVLKLKRPIICGVSDGGQIAFELAMHYPDLIKAIIVTGVLIEVSDAYVEGMKEWGIMGPGVVNFTLLDEVLGALGSRIRETYSPVYGPEYWKTFLEEISKVWLNPEEFPGEKIKDIKVPVLNVHADHDIIPVEEALRIYRLLPHSELAVAPNSEHVFPITNWEFFLALILDFVERHSKD